MLMLEIYRMTLKTERDRWRREPPTDFIKGTIYGLKLAEVLAREQYRRDNDRLKGAHRRRGH